MRRAACDDASSSVMKFDRCICVNPLMGQEQAIRPAYGILVLERSEIGR